MGLKIKEKFKGKIVRRHLPRIGSITIDTEKLKKKDFEKWYKRGLDIFEVFEGEEIEDEDKPVKEVDEDDDINFDDEESEEIESEDHEEIEDEDESELDIEELEKLKLSELREKFPEIKATSKKEFLKELKE